MDPDYYELRQPSAAGTKNAAFTKVYVDTKDDTLHIVPLDKSSLSLKNVDDQVIRKKGFDVDILIVPFKFRPPAFGFPSQLTTDFNGNLFLGYRVDRFKTNVTETPTGLRRRLHHNAFTVGAFGGIGSTFVSPWTTNYRTTDEYSGFIISRGVSAMVGIKSITLGIGVGWDALVDRDKDIWIYQDRAWLGLLVSLNLN